MTGYRQARWSGGDGKLEPLVFEKGGEGRRGCSLKSEGPGEIEIPEDMIREDLELPQLSEPEVVRHFTRLSQMNYGIDSGMYPLGSSTMKYNPKLSEEVASLDGVSFIHPDQPEETVQGALELMYELEDLLGEITGMESFSFQPSAGAHGEFFAMLIVRAYHDSKGEERTEVVVPDSAHGTNPASAAMAGFDIVEIPSNDQGKIDLDALESVVSEKTAALMLTNPNTLGIFEDEIGDVVDLIHGAGGLLFYDGANLNGILGKVRPGDMGFDLVHLNLHKTFSTPHGGGGPGSGPVGMVEELEDFLPGPRVEFDEEEEEYHLEESGDGSVGKVRGFYGNFAVLVKAYTYILSMGGSGLREASETAVLNANYVRNRLKEVDGYELKFGGGIPCKHETVFSADPLKSESGVKASDVSKRLLDYGFYAPTCYFPLIVPEALMIEPTETEPREEIDRFLDAMEEIARDAEECPEKLREAPNRTAIDRIDEVEASRNPILSWRMYREEGD